jgi:hypothetical protein
LIEALYAGDVACLFFAVRFAQAGDDGRAAEDDMVDALRV